ncbi:histidine kinase [Solidesulfovibrio fructosivorans JJ]]|uniref:histidine kinase n=1 Tax=Solidesulfovibrio fructosivorans JJ] TaxID=596151 RepID=E1K0N7_SOLFR|nr:ATP-binding protein [Solidesulfovibrio fructosivorans]EFL49801.1 histidine kinase [Solidesulfovibrio fructosivorans JJ]]
MLTFAHSTYFHDLLGGFSAGVVIANSKGLVYASNPAAATLLGETPQSLADPAEAKAIIARSDTPRGLAHFLAAPIKHGRKPAPITFTYRHPDGTLRHFRLSCSLLLENEKIFGILFEIDDMTEIFALHARERDMLLGIHAVQQERIESLGRFSLAVAHQIRNPLMIIGGFTGRLLRRHPEGDPDAEALAMILDGARRLESVVRAVSSYAKRRPAVPVMADTADLAMRAMETARSRTGCNAPFTVDAAVGLARLDAELTVETLAELLANALEACDAAEEGMISVRARREGETLVLAVEDRGPGVAADIRPFIFDPFFTTKAVGVGMGLCIAKRNAEELGGVLRVVERPGGGCLAELTLPDVPAESAKA